MTLYTCSGLFHSLRYDSEQDPLFEFCRRLDLAAIFGLIAGSCIVTFIYLLPKWWMRASVAAEAAFGITGIVLVWALQDVVAESLLYVYIAMGLIALVPAHLLYRELGHRGMALLFLFAAFYVGAAIVQAVGWPVLAPGLFGAHELFHLGNMIATLLHFVLLVKYALPRGAAARF